MQRRSVDGFEKALKARILGANAEFTGNMHATLPVNADQEAVIRAVQEAIERNAVGGLQPQTLVLGPRNDVGSFDECRTFETRDGAPVPVACKDHRAKELLRNAHLLMDEPLLSCCSLRLRFRSRSQEKSKIKISIDSNFLGIGHERRDRLRSATISDVPLPNSAINFGNIREAVNAASLKRRVAMPQVAKLEGHGTRRSADEIGELDDLRISRADRREWQRQIENERERHLLFRPIRIPSHIDPNVNR
nr:hypothetical protein [Sutterella massiliensis]